MPKRIRQGLSPKVWTILRKNVGNPAAELPKEQVAPTVQHFNGSDDTGVQTIHPVLQSDGSDDTGVQIIHPVQQSNGSDDPIETKLCSRCQIIDFESAFEPTLYNPYDDDDRHSRQLPLYSFTFGCNGMQARNGCPMCNWALYVEQHSSIPKSEFSYRLCAYPFQILLNNLPTDVAVPSFLSFELSKADSYQVCSAAYQVPLLFASGEFPGVYGIDGEKFCVRTLTRTRLSYDTVVKFLRASQNQINSPAPSPNCLPDVLRVVDCQERRIVPFQEGMLYVALSYVWGGLLPDLEEDNQIQDTGRLPSNDRVPQTIMDAMVVVLGTGMRYLWVDRYCIRQFHCPEDKLRQIPAMGDIFESAVFTIVALGDDAECGLPGISYDFLPQFRIESASKTYVSSGVSLQQRLENSKWTERAWCYQEAVLSRHCLFLTPEQAFWLGSRGTVSETLPVLLPLSDESWYWGLSVLNPKQIQPVELRSQAKDTALHAHLGNYSQKHLTEECDRLDAFRGFLSRLDMFSFYGIPISPDCETLSFTFAQSLCWQSHRISSKTRNQNFPSWSWISIRADGLCLKLCESNKKTFYASIEVLLGSERASLKSLVQSNASRLLCEETRTLCITSHTVTLKSLVKGRICQCSKRNPRCRSKTMWSKQIRWDTTEDETRAIEHGYGGLKLILMTAEAPSSQGWKQKSSRRRLQLMSSRRGVDDDLPAASADAQWVRTFWLIIKCQDQSPATRAGMMRLLICQFRKSILTKETLILE